jgi:hypothetical protein
MNENNTDDRTRYYAVGTDGTIIGGGTDDRDTAESWLDNDDVDDLIAARSREEARRKYID